MTEAEKKRKKTYELLTKKNPGIIESLLSPFTNTYNTIAKYTKEGIPSAATNGPLSFLPSGGFIKDTAKAAAGLASFAVPFGRGANFLSKALLPGGVVGGLSGVADNKKSNLLTDILAGAAGAGVLRGATNTLGATKRELTQSLPERLMNSVFKEPIKDTKHAIRFGDTLGKLALKRGEKGMSEQSIYNKAVEALNVNEDLLQSKLGSSSKTIATSTLRKSLEPLAKKYLRAGDTTAAKNISDRITAIETENGKNIPVAIANEIKRTLYEEARPAYGQMASSGAEGLKAVARALKEGIASKVKGVDAVNKELSYHGRIADSLLDKISRGGRNNLLGLGAAALSGGALAAAPATGGMSLAVPLGLGAVGSTAGKTGIANILSKAGQVKSPVRSGILDQLFGQMGGRTGQLISPSVPNPPNGAANQGAPDNSFADIHSGSIPQSQLGGVIPSMQGQSAIQGQAPQATTQAPTATKENGYEGYKSPDGQWVWSAQANDWVPNPEAQQAQGAEGLDTQYGISKEQLNQAIALATDKKTQDFLIAKRKALFTDEASGLSLSDVAIAKITDIQGGLEDVKGLKADLAAEGDQTFPGRSLIAKLPFAEKAKSLQARIDRVKQTVGKALEGGVLRKEDEDKYKKILATIDDPEKVSLQKLDDLEKKLTSDLRRYVASQREYGKGKTGENLYPIENLYPGATGY